MSTLASIGPWLLVAAGMVLLARIDLASHETVCPQCIRTTGDSTRLVRTPLAEVPPKGGDGR